MFNLYYGPNWRVYRLTVVYHPPLGLFGSKPANPKFDLQVLDEVTDELRTYGPFATMLELQRFSMSHFEHCSLYPDPQDPS